MAIGDAARLAAESNHTLRQAAPVGPDVIAGGAVELWRRKPGWQNLLCYCARAFG